MNIDNANFDYRLETELTNALNQIKPDPDFVNRLYKKVTLPAQAQAARMRRGAGLAVLGAGLFFGALIVWLAKTIRRAK